MVSVLIVDAHVHLYDTREFPYAWMKDVPKLNKPHLPADYRAAIGEAPVEQIVFVEVWIDTPHQMAEAEWVSGLFESVPELRGIVAAVALEEGAGAEGALARLAEMEHVKAVRRLIEFEPDVDFCLQPGFVEGVTLLAKYDLSFDICVKHFSARQRRRAGAALPRGPLRARPHRQAADPGGRTRSLARGYSRHGGSAQRLLQDFGRHHRSGSRTTGRREQLRPYLDHAIDSFGIDRVMFGSDWSVSELTHRYEAWVDIVEWTMSGSSKGEMRKLFRDNAISFYRLPQTGG